MSLNRQKAFDEWIAEFDAEIMAGDEAIPHCGNYAICWGGYLLPRVRILRVGSQFKGLSSDAPLQGNLSPHHRGEIPPCLTPLLLHSSQPAYAPPARTPEDPKGYHYFTRDSRRSVMAPLVTENPVLQATALPAGEEGRGAPKSVILDVPLIRPPRISDYQLRRAADQPPSDGYFPVTNYK